MLNFYLLGVAVALVILYFGEKLKNETKVEYISKGYSWSKVIIYSNCISLAIGLIVSFSLEFTKIPLELNPYFIPFAATISTYVLVQSFFTDFRILKINRNILRVGYTAMYLLAMYNVFTNELFSLNKVGLLIFTGVIVFMFIFSPIGASDVRMIAVAMPFVVSIGGLSAVVLFAFSLVLVGIGMEIKNRIQDNQAWKDLKAADPETYKKTNKVTWYIVARKIIKNQKTKEQLATPVGPFMILTFVLYFIAYPFLF